MPKYFDIQSNNLFEGSGLRGEGGAPPQRPEEALGPRHRLHSLRSQGGWTPIVICKSFFCVEKSCCVGGLSYWLKLPIEEWS